VRAPFGLKPMTSIFERGMSHILGDLHFVAVYVDDIVIFSHSMEEHLEHVKLVIDRLTKAKLIINQKKSHFLRTQVVLLGFMVDSNGRRINPDKVANVRS
jgi:cleavage and polyadenylation specificity factor subunit 1